MKTYSKWVFLAFKIAKKYCFQTLLCTPWNRHEITSQLCKLFGLLRFHLLPLWFNLNFSRQIWKMHAKKSKAWKLYSLIYILVITYRTSHLIAMLKTSKTQLSSTYLFTVRLNLLLLSITTRNSTSLTWNKLQNKLFHSPIG